MYKPKKGNMYSCLSSTFEVPNLGLLLGQQMSLSTKRFFHMKYEGRKGTFFLML